MKIHSLVVAVLISFALSSTHAAATQPNVLVVMVDDLGFSDIGCYGGEIETPNLDRLAQNGLRFSQFYNTAKCHSSRISLLTGRYAFQAGNTSLNRAVTSAEVLGEAGYFTAMTGKWHLQEQPTDFGFQRYWGHLSGACNYYKGDKTFRYNGEPWQVPETGFYTTVANVDYALNFLTEARQTEKPWYLYVAFNAPHAPLQPMEEDYKKYLGRYDVGWDTIREARLEKQKKLGLFGKDLTPSPRPDHIPTWSSLPKERQVWESHRMSALAGMIDRVDQELGRLLADLEKTGEMENTLILFVSDNGACPYDRRSNNMDGNPYDRDTTWGDSTGWSWARNSPFRYYKQNQFEGGISTPAIVHWPKGLKAKPGSMTHQPAHLVDVLPTLADLTDTKLPKQWSGRELEPVSGISLLPILKGEKIENRPPIHLLFGTDRGLRDGDWKLVSFRSQPWELYNLANDRTELNNLAAKNPNRVKRMSKLWHEMAEDVLKAPERSRTPVAAEATLHDHPEWTDFTKVLSGIGKREDKKPAIQ
jgi:arylsulfatase A-like enzyme